MSGERRLDPGLVEADYETRRVLLDALLGSGSVDALAALDAVHGRVEATTARRWAVWARGASRTGAEFSMAELARLFEEYAEIKEAQARRAGGTQ